MPISAQGIQLLKELEGSDRHAYKDVAGLLTIGIGHCLTKDELTSGKIPIGTEDVHWRDGLTDAQIEQLLRQDLARLAEPLRQVEAALPRPLTQGQIDALAIFIFNIGPTAFLKSTMCKYLKAGNYEAVPAQFERWVFSGGLRVPGLVNRRDQEVACWKQATPRF